MERSAFTAEYEPDGWTGHEHVPESASGVSEPRKDFVRVRMPDRRGVLAQMSPCTAHHVDDMLALATHGLSQMHVDGTFAHTVRLNPRRDGVRCEGESLRHAAIVALGTQFLPMSEQKRILKGETAAELATRLVGLVEHSRDPGEVAIAAWASAEAGAFFAEALFHRLTELFLSGAPIYTVDTAWALMAAIAGGRYGETEQLLAAARAKLLDGQSASGLFPHVVPASIGGFMRGHVGSFSDQVYPIKALSRLYGQSGDQRALHAAEAAAAQICALQGEAGQWWWHYDTRGGSVVEGYPVYSVHQHATAPMALLDLREAGGTDQMASAIKGVQWLSSHPETREEMVQEEFGVIWRKVARRDPKKAVRALSALTTRLRPGLKLPGLDRLFPPACIDYECRPYELGWMLYAWLGSDDAWNSRERRA